MPAACAKMKKCIDALGAKMPAAKASYEKAWQAMEMAMKGPGKATVEKSCQQALVGYAKVPDAPADCK